MNDWIDFRKRLETITEELMIKANAQPRWFGIAGKNERSLLLMAMAFNYLADAVDCGIHGGRKP